MNAKRDQNRITTAIAVSNADGTTIDLIKVNPTGHGIQIVDGSTGTDHGTVNAQRDLNHIPVWIGISSVDGTTPVEIYTNGSGKLLVQSS